MTLPEAKRILTLFRPGTADATDAEFAEALELARDNAELRAWFDQHCAFQTAMRKNFRQIEPPADLKARLGEARKLVRLRYWRRRAAWMAAAAAVVVLGLAVSQLIPQKQNLFADWASRMVGTVLRQYGMDLTTSDQGAARQFLTSQGAPSDYILPKGLEKLTQTGAGALRWRDKPVSMVCFDRGDGRMLFLFVMNNAAIKDPPHVAPKVAKVNKLLTVGWTRGDKTYLLAGPQDQNPAKYLEETK